MKSGNKIPSMLCWVYMQNEFCVQVLIIIKWQNFFTDFLDDQFVNFSVSMLYYTVYKLHQSVQPV